MSANRILRAVLCAWAIASTAKAAAPREKEWAFLIFLNANNNLAPYSELNINQLETVGSTADIDVVVQWGRLGNNDTYRLRVEKDADPNKVTSPFLETLPRQDMGDYKNLVEFVRWSAARFPAKRYFVSFWNHGSGWHRRNGKPVRGISFDDYSGHHITTEEMGIAMRQISGIIGKRVDIVGADACLMGMVEVGAEMADSTDFLVASQDLEPGLGWPYHTFFAHWAANPKASSAEISRYLVQDYYDYLSPTQEITLSALHIAKFPLLADALRTVKKTVDKLSVADLTRLRAATSTALKFYYPDYVDLGNWLKKAQGLKDLPLDPDALKGAADILATFVTANKVTAKFAAAEGVSIWVPPTKADYQQYEKRYTGLRFHKETGWGDIVGSFVSLPLCAPHPEGQWASGVISFSSQYGTGGWSANQALGACDTATYGDFNTAWAPLVKEGPEEHLAVGFAKPVHATGAVIRETLGNGFVSRVEAIDTAGAAHLLWQGQDISGLGTVIDFEVRWPRTEYLVQGLKITVDNTKSPGVWKEIDSVQLLGRP